MQPLRNESGAALITALIFLIIITLLSLSAMRSSVLEMRQAANDEVRVAAFEHAQAIIDAVLDTPANLPVIGDVGYLYCTKHETGCVHSDLTLTDGMYADEIDHQQVRIRVQRLGFGDSPFGPPPRGLGTSAKHLTATSFKIDAEYNRAADGLGRADLSQGVMVVVPKSQ